MVDFGLRDAEGGSSVRCQSDLVDYGYSGPVSTKTIKDAYHSFCRMIASLREDEVVLPPTLTQRPCQEATNCRKVLKQALESCGRQLEDDLREILARFDARWPWLALTLMRSRAF